MAPQKPPRHFASDNNAGVHPRILEALNDLSRTHALAYGEDDVTHRTEKLFKKEFGPNTESYLVFNGTAANTLALSTLLNPWEAVVCSEHAHIHSDEAGAPERFTGSKLLLCPSKDGKITTQQIEAFFWAKGDQHRVQPKAISITQTTELGAVYSVEEIRTLCDFAHKNNMYVHMDGARIANAAVALSQPFRAFTTDVGVDVLSFGGTKIGLMGGEAVVFLNPKLSENFKFARKQGMQLASKMRFIARQFEVLLNDRLWEENAKNANSTAILLEKRVREIAANGAPIEIARPVQANALFVRLKPDHISQLKKKWNFHVWDEALGECRWMTSWDTTANDVNEFCADLKQLFNS